MRFNSPPGWPVPPTGWTPPADWRPDPSWPAPPDGWQLWLSDGAEGQQVGGPEEPPLRTEEGDEAARSARATTTDKHALGPDPALLLARIATLEAALRERGSEELVDLNDQRVLQDVGIYRYHHPLEDAAAYKDRLTALNQRVDEILTAGKAVLAADMFTFDGSLAKGRRMLGDFSKLMLRAYNAEADNCVRSLRAGNIATAKKRLERSVTTIAKLGAMMEMRINPDYHELRLVELELTADYQMKLQEERERAREERQLLREQRRVEAELAAERERLEKERAHYASVLEALRAKGDEEAANELAGRLADIDSAIEANDYRTANIRAGYVYVISNIGAFGPNVVKIGMTRRLEPRDRVKELGDASVPFPYDVHALFFSDDAIALEGQLHKAFADRRVNRVNERREFFFATPMEVRERLMETVGGLLEFTEEPEAAQYFQSRGQWPSPE